MGNIMHPQVKSIAIAQIDNNSSEPFVATYLKQALAEQFQVDGSLKLEDLRNADCILYAKVLNVETTGIGQDSANSQTTYRPASWSVSVEFEWTVLIPGRAEPLISRMSVMQFFMQLLMWKGDDTWQKAMKRLFVPPCGRQAAVHMVGAELRFMLKTAK